MKVDFVFPLVPYKFSKNPYPPLGIGYLSSVVKTLDFVSEISMIDGQLLEEKKFWTEIVSLETDVCLISSTLRQMKGAFRVAKEVKSRNPHAFVCLGGSGPTSLSKTDISLVREEKVDMIFLGEAERAISSLLKNFYEKKFSNSDFVWKFEEGEGTMIGPIEQTGVDVKNIGWPDRSIFNMEAYLSRWKKATGITSTQILGSRGCPFSCIFCESSVTGDVPRFRGAQDIVNEMKFIDQVYEVDDIFYFDSLFTLRKEFVLEVCDLLIKEERDLNWSAQGRVDCIDKEMLVKMKRAGCEELMFGVETGSPKLLDFLKKGFSREQAVRAFDLCHEVGVKPGMYLIVGIPGETKKDIKDTISLVERTKPWLLNFSYLTPFPGTVLYKKTKSLIGDWDFENWDDFGKTIYDYDFDIEPKKAEEMIRKAYYEIMKDEDSYCSYQF